MHCCCDSLIKSTLWIWFIAPGAFLASACTKVKKDQRQAAILDNGRQLEAQSSSLGILSINADLREDGLLLHVSGIPDGSTLECSLDQLPLIPCSDGGLYAKPSAGDHKISVTALTGNAVTAVGESPVFTVAPGVTGALISTSGPNSLALALDDPNFSNGGNWSLGKDFTVRFKMIGKPSCDQPQVKCKVDSRTGWFWVSCDAGGTSFSIAKEQLALGLQFLTVQASCPDRVGPPLSLFWYGVPDGYQPLMLRDISDAHHRHIVDLIKQDDCPYGSQRIYECAPNAADSFSACAANSNSIDQPQAGYRVRLTCATAVGPVLVLGS